MAVVVAPTTLISVAAAAPSASPLAVSIVSADIGADAREAAASDKQYNLKLVFSLVSGSYLSDIPIEITDTAGKRIIAHVAYGPWAYAHLPAGTYIVKADLDGAVQTKRVAIGAKGRKTVHFRWKAEKS
jgi:hypothetical protein